MSKKTKTKNTAKADEKRWKRQATEAKRVQKVVAEQYATREKIRMGSRDLEPTHAVISCPDCAARLLVGVSFVEHRV